MRYIIIAIFFLFATSGAMAKGSNKVSEKAAKSYLISLGHQNPGVVGSAIVGVIKMKQRYPCENYSDITVKLDELSTHNAIKNIRIKAFLASNFLKYPERYDWFKNGDFEEVVNSMALYTAQLNKHKANIQKESMSLAQ